MAFYDNDSDNTTTPYAGTLTSFGSMADGKNVKRSVFTFQGNTGSGMATLSSDKYYVRRKLGRVELRDIDDSDNLLDWSAYIAYQDLGNIAFRATYTVKVQAGTETTYTNETVTIAEIDSYSATGDDGTSDGELAQNLWVQEIHAEFGDIGGWLVDSTTIKSDSGNVSLDSSTPKITLGAATAPLVGKGVFLGKSGGVYQFRVGGDPATVDKGYFLWDDTDFKIINAGLEVYNGATQTGNINRNGSAWFGSSSSNKTIQWWTTGASANDVRIGGSGDYILWDDSAASLTVNGGIFASSISVTGTLTVGGALVSDDYVAGSKGWKIGASGKAEFKDIEARGEFHAAVFVKGLIKATAGSEIIAKSAGSLKNAVTTATSPTTFNVDVKDPPGGHAQLFSTGDILRLKNEAGLDNWVTVSSVSDQTTYYRYVCTKNNGTNGTFQPGTVIVDYGASGQGFLYLTADDSDGPFYSVRTHAGSPWTTTTERGRFGNMKNAFGTGANNYYGFGVGDYSGGNYLKYETNGGFSLHAGGDALLIDSDGLTLNSGNGSVNYVKWNDGANTIFGQYGMMSGTTSDCFIYAQGKNSTNRESVLNLLATTDDGAAHAGTGTVSIRLDTELDSGSVYIVAPTIGLTGAVSATSISTGTFTSTGIDDNSNAVAVTIDSTERLLAGYATSIPYRAGGVNNTIQVANSNTVNSIAGFQAIRFSADASGARLTLGKSRNTSPGSHTIIQADDELALIDFLADDGTLHLAAASIVAKVDGTPGTNDVPGRLEFYTTADGAAAPSLVMTIKSTGRVGIGTASPTSGYKLETSDSILVNSSTNNSGFVSIFTGASSASVGPQNSFTTNDGAAMATSDRIGALLFNGYNGTSVVLSAAMIARSTETWSGTARGSRIEFLTTPNGSTSIATVLTIDHDGALTSTGKFTSIGIDDNASATALTIGSGGWVGIGDTSDANVTLGLTINQSTNDNYGLTIKSSTDVAHGITDEVETDTYFGVKKVDGTAGGADIYGFKDAAGNAGGAIRIRGVLGEAVDTTRSTAALGVIALDAMEQSGTGSIAVATANGNLVVIRSKTTTRFIFDVEGDSHEDGTGWTAYDDHDDIALLDKVNTALLKAKDPIDTEFWMWVQDNAAILQELKLITFNLDGHHFINRSKMQELLVGAMRQMGSRLAALEARMQ